MTHAKAFPLLILLSASVAGGCLTRTVRDVRTVEERLSPPRYVGVARTLQVSTGATGSLVAVTVELERRCVRDLTRVVRETTRRELVALIHGEEGIAAFAMLAALVAVAADRPRDATYELVGETLEEPCLQPAPGLEVAVVFPAATRLTALTDERGTAAFTVPEHEPRAGFAVVEVEGEEPTRVRYEISPASSGGSTAFTLSVPYTWNARR